MKAVRPLARVVGSIGGESFVSYVERLAAMHKVDLLVILNMLGIIKDEEYERLNGYGVLLTDAQLERFSIATKMTKDQAANLLLSSYSGIAFDLQGVVPGDADALRKRTISEWAYFSGSHVCPHCIRESGGAWQLAWKLPWSFACPIHKCYLVATCPSCSRRLGTGRTDRSLSPVFVRLVPKPGYCGNPKPFGVGRLGRSSTPCGHPLAEIPTVRASKSALQSQQVLNDILGGSPPPTLGASVPALEFIKDLRSLCALILYCAEPEDLGKISAAEMDAFSAFAIERDRIRAERIDAATPRNSARTRVFYGCQDSPELMAAASGLALKILAAESAEAMSTMLRPLAEHCIAHAPKRRWNIMEFLRFSDRIAPAFHQSLAHYSTFDRSIGNRSLEVIDTGYAFEPRHVPQLLWMSDYNASFSRFLPDITENFGRRFCSMSLVKLCGDYTWGQTASLLGLPEPSSIKMANKCVGLLADELVKKEFGQALHALARRLSDDSQKIDFEVRREAFSTLLDIPQKDWVTLCNAAGITPGQPGRRSKYAAVWLWAYLTGGDWTLAPGLEGEHLVNSREVYRSLCKSILPKVIPHLKNYGQVLADKATRQARRTFKTMPPR